MLFIIIIPPPINLGTNSYIKIMFKLSCLWLFIFASPVLSFLHVPGVKLDSKISFKNALSSNTRLHLMEDNTNMEEIVPITPLVADDYVAVGLACCFLLDPDTQKVEEAYIYEPLTAGTLETIHLGVPTSYKRVIGISIGELFQGNEDINNPTTVNREALTQLFDGMESVTEAEEFVVRTLCAARTFRRRVEAKSVVDIGNMRDNFNFDVTRKRILNEVYEPSFDDNVKQDKSIDVYGRSDDVDAAEIERLANA